MNFVRQGGEHSTIGPKVRIAHVIGQSYLRIKNGLIFLGIKALMTGSTKTESVTTDYGGFMPIGTVMSRLPNEQNSIEKRVINNVTVYKKQFRTNVQIR